MNDILLKPEFSTEDLPIIIAAHERIRADIIRISQAFRSSYNSIVRSTAHLLESHGGGIIKEGEKFLIHLKYEGGIYFSLPTIVLVGNVPENIRPLAEDLARSKNELIKLKEEAKDKRKELSELETYLLCKEKFEGVSGRELFRQLKELYE